MKKHIYIAAPYTHPDPVVNTNFAIRIAENLLELRFIPIIPHLCLVWHLVQPHLVEFWYAYDLEILHRCDALLRIGGASTGADKDKRFYTGPSIGKKASMGNYGINKGGAFRKDKMCNKRCVWSLTTKGFGGAHFATFPKKLVVPMLRAGCPSGGIVLDPFFGAGTTGVVAKENNRNFIGIELNPNYIKMAQRRIDNTQESLF